MDMSCIEVFVFLQMDKTFFMKFTITLALCFDFCALDNVVFVVAVCLDVCFVVEETRACLPSMRNVMLYIDVQNTAMACSNLAILDGVKLYAK